ncbi:DsbE family thiol:disulfide interchange protein [Kangiella koreensis]|uniref:Periplasmic protein thiol/disulphide oxidoreductase DsbE n=1 Tax=Kangiella koreensis (strain DSM 16069 / JCM 12317 / KCTC 12182 / SW-125) TaxID=523791 RepID=C7RAW2_KANKD|nr:DsbE family thiol:disulfide interchange protein [Kangiella koreensis]ACV26404.1 periplasmic protein thiol/disulphide oxidoreductase DsbE [Kangiella koreensis DSM 16069]
MGNKKILITSIPIIIFTALVIVFWFSLGSDPTELPSQRIGKQVPEFRLSNLHNPEEAFTNKDLPNKPFLLNVWATWCVSCHVEHPYLVKFANQYPIPIIGLNYKDVRVDALQYLQKGGDPYLFSIADEDGTMGIDLGVYGAPETFIVDGDGVIHHRYVGVIDERVWNTVILPKMKELDPSLAKVEVTQ